MLSKADDNIAQKNSDFRLDHSVEKHETSMSDVSGIRVMTDISALTGLARVKEEQRDSTDTQKEELQFGRTLDLTQD